VLRFSLFSIAVLPSAHACCATALLLFSLQATMEQCSEIVSEAYAKPPENLDIFTGELPPGHRSTDRRQR
jgi:hypothetical protein